MPDNQSDTDRKIDMACLFMRKDRPLPKPGCSWAFFIFLGLLTIGLVVMYLLYRKGFKDAATALVVPSRTCNKTVIITPTPQRQ